MFPKYKYKASYMQFGELFNKNLQGILKFHEIRIYIKFTNLELTFLYSKASISFLSCVKFKELV